MGAMSIRHLAFCLCPGLPLFGLVSALEVLRHANRLGGRETYRWSFLTEQDTGVLGSNGMLLQPDSTLQAAHDAEMIFVAAGFQAWDLQLPRLARWLNRQIAKGAVAGGISNGSFVLANMGVLDGFAATVHWEDFITFYESYPAVKSRYQRFVVDGKRMSCSGGAATLDMFFEIVRKDLGAEVVQKISRQMLLDDYPEHRGVDPSAALAGQSFAEHRGRYSPAVQRILGLLDAVIEGPMNVGSLAERVGLSRRELLRLLKRETGQTPSQILNQRRLERARSLVQNSHLPLAAVAVATGFSSQSHLTLRYRQMYATTPARERRSSRLVLQPA